MFTQIYILSLLTIISTSARIRLEISEEEKVKVEQKIEDLLTSQTIYDVECKIEKADSGYNIFVVNQAQPESIQSFIDPTIVAWYIANYTKGTNWKSETLFIWTRPYKEGWGILTKDCRFATRRAQNAAGYLGLFGIVDVSTLRKEVSKKFFRLRPSTGETIKNIIINPWLILILVIIVSGVALFLMYRRIKGGQE